MSTKLRIRLDKYLDGQGAWDGLVANVWGLDAQGRRDHARDRSDLIIPAGPGAASLDVPVEAGDYVVQATLPSGDIASTQVTVAEGDSPEVALQAPHSPNEWLSWQQFIGNVPALPAVPVRQERKSPGGRPAATQLERIEDFVREHDTSRSGRMAVVGEAGIRAGRLIRERRVFGGRCGAIPPTGGGARAVRSQGAKETPSKVVPWPVVWFIRHPVAVVADATAGNGAWSLLGAAETGRKPLAALSVGPAARATPQFEQADFRRYAFGGEGDLMFGSSRNPGGDQLPRRYVVAIRSRGPVEVACLPVPWDSVNGHVPVELLVRRHPTPGEAMLALSPEDPTVRSALGYMGAGALSNARLMFDRARGMLFEKMVNPLGAAAGGYVLLATEQGSGEQPWHQWIMNLANWFDWLPDGQIQYGRLRLLRRTGEADVRAARAAFFAAYDRGIPFYSLGLQWLVDGLSLLASGDDQEARDRLKAVQEVTWKANLQQPFTTLRLRDR